MENQNLITARFSTLQIPVNNFMEMGNDGSEDGKCSLNGASGLAIGGMMIDPWLKLGHNCTITLFDNLGRFDDNSGVKGAIRLNKSDGSLFPTQVFENQDVDYPNPLYDDFLQITCAYNYTEELAGVRDVMDSYVELHWSFYSSLIPTIAIFIMCWRTCEKFSKRMSSAVRRELQKSRLPGHWVALCAFLDQNQYPNLSMVSFSIMSTVCAVFFFVAINGYMMNVMCADLVVIKQPQVVRTYQDVFDREDVNLLFFSGWDEEAIFKDAKPGTVEHRMWQKRSPIEEVSMGAIAKIWQPIIDQKIVAISREWLGRAAAALGLSKTREMGINYIRAIETKDGKYFTASFMFGKHAPKILKDFYHKRSLLIGQSGILEWYLKSRAPLDFSGASDVTLPQYLSKSIFSPDPPPPEIRFQNFKKINIVFYAFIFSCFPVLFVEIFMNPKRKEGEKESLKEYRRNALKVNDYQNSPKLVNSNTNLMRKLQTK